MGECGMLSLLHIQPRHVRHPPLPARHQPCLGAQPGWHAIMLQVLPGLMTERGSGGRTTVIAQSEVTSEETRVERKVRPWLSRSCEGPSC